MKKNSRAAQPKPVIRYSTLEKGQIWKMGEVHLQIIDAGRRLIHYRMAKTLKQRGLRNHLASIEAVQAYLESNQAERLVEN